MQLFLLKQIKQFLKPKLESIRSKMCKLQEYPTGTSKKIFRRLEGIFVTEISGCQIKYCVLEDEVSVSGSLGRGLISTGSETASEPRLEVSLNGGAGGFSSSSDDIFFSSLNLFFRYFF